MFSPFPRDNFKPTYVKFEKSGWKKNMLNLFLQLAIKIAKHFLVHMYVYRKS
jgi:hypothetical protein